MSNAPVVGGLVKEAQKLVSPVTEAIGITEKRRAPAARAAAQASAGLTAAERRERGEEAAASGALRARAGRAGGYRSLLSSARMTEMASKGSKTTLGG